MSPSAPAPRPVEVELKYRLLNDAAGDRYLFADELGEFTSITPVRSTQLEDRYLDTGDGALARAGFAARLRQTAKGTTVSVKSLARRPAGVGAHRREELEGPADRTAGPRDWAASDARSLILEQCGDAPLVEVVTIRQLRRKRKLQWGATIVEVSLDEVDVVARSRVVERFVELEIELVEGDEAALERIESMIADDPGLVPSTGSKLEAALSAIQALDGQAGQASRRIPRAHRARSRSTGNSRCGGAGGGRAGAGRAGGGGAGGGRSQGGGRGTHARVTRRGVRGVRAAS